MNQVPIKQQPVRRRRWWWEADRSQLYVRVFALESELSVAASLLDLREQEQERQGGARSAIVTELQQKWRALLDEQPVLAQEIAA